MLKPLTTEELDKLREFMGLGCAHWDAPTVFGGVRPCRKCGEKVAGKARNWEWNPADASDAYMELKEKFICQGGFLIIQAGKMGGQVTAWGQGKNIGQCLFGHVLETPDQEEPYTDLREMQAVSHAILRALP